MDQLLDKIKERVAQRDSPIKTIKGVVEAIGMTEGGFYTMLKRGRTKHGTILAIADAIQVDVSYFDELSANKSSKTDNFGEDVLGRITKEMQATRQVFEEELKMKNQQIANLQEMLKMVLGKFEGATIEPTSIQNMTYPEMAQLYHQLVMGEAAQLLSKAIVMPDAKLVAPHSNRIGIRPQ